MKSSLALLSSILAQTRNFGRSVGRSLPRLPWRPRLFLHPVGRRITVLLLTISLLCLPYLPGAAVSANFYYFNPDSTLSNLNGLKQIMDSFLTAAGLSFSFQPFSKLQDFDRQMKEAPPALLFLPEWYLAQDSNAKKIKPLMNPVRHGATTYRKVLLVAANSDLTVGKLTGPTIAMTPVGPAGLAMLNEAIFKKNGLDANKLNFITTAKDSDALFALALGQVKAALISEESLKHIGKINARIATTVKTLAVSAPIPLPVLCYTEGSIPADLLEKLQKSLLAGKDNRHTAQLMELLDIDAWQTSTQH